MTYEELKTKIGHGGLKEAENAGLLPGNGNNKKVIVSALKGYNFITSLIQKAMYISFFTPDEDQISEFEDYCRRKIETIYANHEVATEEDVIAFCNDEAPIRRHWTTETYNQNYFVQKNGRLYWYNFCHYTDRDEKCYKTSISAVDFGAWLHEYYDFKKEQNTNKPYETPMGSLI
jgi:hypothetical protein